MATAIVEREVETDVMLSTQRTFLSEINSLPYGHSVFFPAKVGPKFPIHLTENEAWLGVNHNGMHIFQKNPRLLLQTLPLDAIISAKRINNVTYVQTRHSGFETIDFESNEDIDIVMLLQAYGEREGQNIEFEDFMTTFVDSTDPDGHADIVKAST